MNPAAPNSVSHEVYALLDEYRDRCLWYVRADYYPSTGKEAQRLLEAIARHGDRLAYQRARELMERLPEWP